MQKKLWNLQHVLVTIDGPEPIYNRIKAYNNSDDSAYRRVLSNIDLLLDAGITVTVNLSLDANNADNQFDLADELGQRFAGKMGFLARAGLLVEYVGKITRFDSTEHALTVERDLNKRLDKYGILEKNILKTKLNTNSCMADDPCSVVILPDGRIGRCEHYGDREEVGSIYDAEPDAVKLSSWKELRPVDEKCRTCAAYPKCVRLKKCSATPNPCEDLFRENHISMIKDRMTNTYEKWKTGSSENTGEE